MNRRSQRIGSGSPFEQRFGFSRAVRAGRRVLVSGTAPIWPDGSCDPDPGTQARRCLQIIAAALEDAGAGMDDVVRTRMFIVDRADSDAVGVAHGEVFGRALPAATMVVVAGLLDPRWKVEIEAEAAWLGTELEAQDAVEMCVPLDAGRMQSAPANPKLNKVGKGIEGPELLVVPA